jgi:hypothetical protein
MRDRQCQRRHSGSYSNRDGRLYCPNCREDRGPAPVSVGGASSVPETVSVVASTPVEALVEPPVEAEVVPQAEVTLPEGAPAEVPQRRRNKGVGTVRTRGSREG